LEYERALELDKLLDDIEEQRESVSKRATKTPAPGRESFTTPFTPDTGRDFNTPLKTPGKNTNRQSSQPNWNGDTSIFESNDEGAIEGTREQKIKKHFEEWVYPGWQELVAIEDNGVRPRPIGMERFDAGESANGTTELYLMLYRACLHQNGS
jgi:hypothetical protein